MPEESKKKLVFHGHWKTQDGSTGYVNEGRFTVESCKHDCFIGWILPLDEQGHCPLNPGFNLYEKIRDCEGYSL